jgi:hypothetical protein
MKSSTYASLVSIVFIKHRDEISTSIDGAIRSIDNLCKNLGMKCDLSHMTKYRIITELLESKILVSRKTKKNKKLRISKTILDTL